MFHAPAIVCALLSASAMAALAQDPILSPTQKTNLRAARLNGLPLPPVNTNQYKLAAAMNDVAWRTQTLALVTVTIVTTNSGAVLVWKNGKYEKYLPAARPVVISVVTNQWDLLNAPEVSQ